MIRRYADDAAWDDRDADDDPDVTDTDEMDFGDDDEELTIACPWCRAEIHEDAPRCPHCGNFISKEDGPSAPKPGWLILGAILALLVVLSWIAM